MTTTISTTGGRVQLGVPNPATGGGGGGSGAQLLHGHGAPTGAVGADGDYYLNQDSTTLYGPKASGSWPAPGVTLIGPPGNPGPKGDTGAAGAAGAAGAVGPAGPAFSYGILATRPSVGAAGDKGLYYATDQSGGTLYQVQGGAWGQITRGLTQAPVAHGTAHATGASDTVPHALRTITANDSVTSSDDTIAVNANGVTVTLPNAATTPGRVLEITNDASADDLVTGTTVASAGGLIAGSASVNFIGAYSTLTVRSNGTNWMVV